MGRTVVSAALAVWAFVAVAAEVVPYRDPTRKVGERVGDLLARMTLEEKCAQLGRYLGFNAYERTGNDIVIKDEVAKAIEKNPPGKIYGLRRACWWSRKNWQNGIPPERAAEVVNAMQRIAVEKTRLGIPLFFVEEAPHGIVALGETVFPTGLALGSTFDEDLLRRIGLHMGESIRRGVHGPYAPIVDLARDPRWSRCEECFGEDPELVATLSAAQFSGMKAWGMEPCLKHFAGGGNVEGGHNMRTVHMGPVEFFNYSLRPFRRIIPLGAHHIMTTYHDVDGETCTGSDYLVNEVLRGQLGFDGFVVADGGAIQLLHSRRVAATLPEAAAMAMKAGGHLESCARTPDKCGAFMLSAYRENLIGEAEIDKALTPLLRVKFEMGLFENPYVGNALPDRAEGRKLTLEAARKGCVLLENRDRTLPLKKEISVAVIGPNANDKVMNQLGDYTAPQIRSNVVTVLDGVKQMAARVAYAKGCGIRSKKRDGFAEAEKIAEASDVTVLVLGGSSSPFAGTRQNDMFGGATEVTGNEDEENDKESGEGTDRSSLELLGAQKELFRAVRAKAKKLVVVLVQGRPLHVEEIAEQADAVLLAWYPGPMGGKAVAEILFGETNPSGRLSVSIPRNAGQLPVTGDWLEKNRPRYIDGPGDAAYPFGYGLSYSTFEYRGIRLVRAPGTDARGEIEVEIGNTSARDGDEIVRVYFQVTGFVRQRPYRELLAFRRVPLKAGETKRVRIPFDAKLFGSYNRHGTYDAPRGSIKVWADGCKETLTFKGAELRFGD
ncbi:MAG: glycoside hydrolase family 3 N-terminal domain-containing protein [Kiritimatiellia bacterium]